MEDFATMDTGVLDAEFVDDGVESTALTTQDESAETGQEDPPEGAESTAVALRPSELMASPGKLAEATKTALESIKASNPGIAAGLQRVIHHFDQIRREFPGGMKELRTMRERLEAADELGGEGGLATLKDELAGFREYDRQFMTADPAFVRTMLDAEPGAFQRLAPVIFSEFQKVNPAGYATLIAQGTMASMNSDRLPFHLETMGHYLTEASKQLAAENSPLLSTVNRAIDAFNNGPGAYLAKIEAASKSEIKMPDAAKPADESLKNREANLTKKEWAVDTGKSLASIYKEEFTKQTAGRKLSDTQRSNIAELFSMKLQKALTNTDGYEERVNRYVAAGDRQGNLRYQTSLYRQHTERILGSLLGPGKARTAGTATNQRPSENGQPIVPPVAASGFIMLSKMPGPSEISPRTTMQMIDQNKAILLDGRKVTWK